MHLLIGIASVVLIVAVLVDAFESTILPRQVLHRWRFVRLYYRNAWRAWRLIARLLPLGKRRDGLLGWFGPLSVLGLFACWCVGLIVGFGLLNWASGQAIRSTESGVTGPVSFGTYLYLSGVTFFTVGDGEFSPASTLARFLTIFEGGLGFGFLACVISYVPVLYQAFARREATISLLDARAGSPPTASELMLRLARSRHLEAADALLHEWERWSAELLESHLSFPSLGYYRSQHANQSWLAAVTTMLDTCSIMLAGVKGLDPYRAQLTFAMARHAVVDLSLVLRALTPRASAHASPAPRVTVEQLGRLREQLANTGVEMHELTIMEAKLTKLRSLYEPFVAALAAHFLFELPPIVVDQPAADNWQRSAWLPRAPGFSNLPAVDVGEMHF